MNKKLYDQVQAYFDNELMPEDRRRIESVIAGSSDCQELLKQWGGQRGALSHLKNEEIQAGAFVNRVMTCLEELELPAEAEPAEQPAFLRWFFPAMGYALSSALVFLTLSLRQPVVSADTILLSVMPEETHGVFRVQKTDVSQMFDTEEMK